MSGEAESGKTPKRWHAWVDFVFFIVAAITWAEILLLGARTHVYHPHTLKLQHVPSHWARWTLLIAIGVSLFLTAALEVARRSRSVRLSSSFKWMKGRRPRSACTSLASLSVHSSVGSSGESTQELLRRQPRRSLRPS